MAIKMHVIYALVASFLLAACGQATSGMSAPRASPMTSASASPTLVGATLLETCPQIDSVLADLSSNWTGAEWKAARQKVQTLSDAGDLETQNALTVLLAALETLQSEPEGQAWLDAKEARDNALSNLNRRCRTAGTSTVQ